MQRSVTNPTIPIGISRSVIGNVSALPALRARFAAIAPARPCATGLISFINVQIAETPIAPAPRKRTFVRQTVFAIVATFPLRSPLSAEKCGTPQPQPMIVPTSMAIPTATPQRCPIASNANDREKS